MAASTWRSSQPFLGSQLASSTSLLSPKTPSITSTSTTFASPAAKAFSPASSSFAASPSRPTRVNLYTPTPRAASAKRLPLESPTQKRTCMCSPSTHPGAFRCRLHKKSNSSSHSQTQTKTVSSSNSSSRFEIRKIVTMNSLARSRIVKGDLVKRAFTTLFRPSSQQQCRPGDFRPRPSRLSVMSKTEDSWK